MRDGKTYPEVGISHFYQLLRIQRETPLFPHRRDEEHIRVAMVFFHFKNFVGVFREHTWGEWSERLAEFDFNIHYLLHFFRTRVAQYATRTERPRPVLHASLEPSDYFFPVQYVCRFF